MKKRRGRRRRRGTSAKQPRRKVACKNYFWQSSSWRAADSCAMFIKVYLSYTFATLSLYYVIICHYRFMFFTLVFPFSHVYLFCSRIPLLPESRRRRRSSCTSRGNITTYYCSPRKSWNRPGRTALVAAPFLFVHRCTCFHFHCVFSCSFFVSSNLGVFGLIFRRVRAKKGCFRF